MLDEAAFLRAIWESPYDDAPRLVYADWLEERGDTNRAELIRIQCGKAGLAESDPRRQRLGERESELLRLTASWLHALPQCRPFAPFRREIVEAKFLWGFPFPSIRITAAQ